MATSNSKTVVSTVKQIEALRARESTYEVRVDQCPGLRLRISPQGRLTWFHRYSSPESGKTVKLTLGYYIKAKPGQKSKGMSLADAKAVWTDNSLYLRKGLDPKVVQEKASTERRALALESEALKKKNGHTIEMLVRDYLDDISDRKRSWREDLRILNRHLVPCYGDASVHAMRRSDVRAILEPLRREGKHVQANRILASVRAMFNWAMRNDWPDEDHAVQSNPCQGIEATKEQARARALNDKELRKLLRGLPKHLDEQATDLIGFILATGARIGEAIDMKWSDIFDDEWRLTDTKNRQEHIVFLSDYAQSILERQKSDSPNVWPNPATHNGKLRRETASKGLQEALPELGIEAFTPHDLRRTFGAWLGRNEVEERVHDRCLNHVFSGIRSVYNVASYDEKARQAWQQWGEHLQALSSSNVATLRGRRV